MNLPTNLGFTTLLSGMLVLSACGDESDAPVNNTPVNRAPIANAGSDKPVDELSVVTLDGSLSSDPDGDSLTFSWAQQSGTSVTLSGAASATATFDAPDVTAIDTSDILVFRLTVDDGPLSASSDVTITVNDVGLGVNSPPTSDAGPDQTVAELSTVNLDGTASDDPDGDLLSYTWLQLSGPGVTLSNVNIAEPDFTSPNVAPATPEFIVFQLTVDDGSDSASDTVEIRVQEGLSQVNVAGVVQYEWVPTSTNSFTCSGLNFAATEERPIRAATVQVGFYQGAVFNVIATTVSGDDGSYSFDNIDANTDAHVRVRAELKRSGGFPNWDVEVRDNVDLSPSPPALDKRPLYVFESAQFNTGVAHINDADFTATTGWGGGSYTGNRAAAPFAILDMIYTGMKFVMTVDGTASFAPLDAFWSVNNTKTDGTPTDIDIGELGGSFYNGGIDSLFLTGDEDVDTGEFDFGVTLHEWAHYFEDNFSRSDSVGGTHFLGDPIEARVAFGEGFGYGLAAMAWGDPMSCNTGRATGQGSWGFNVETYNGGPQGWYNEMSIATLLLDLYDTDNDGTDNSSIGFAPIYDIMTGPQTTTEAFTTLFSFASLLRPTLSAPDQNFLNALLAAENIETTGLDIWATEQDKINIAPNNMRDVLPLYTDYGADGSLLKICTNSDHETDRDGNKPAEHRYLRVTTTGSAAYDVAVVPNPVPPPTADAPDPDDPTLPRDRSDPDVFIYRNGGLIAFGNSGVGDSETFTTQILPADVYAVDLQEWRYADEDASTDFPEQICFDFRMTAR